ncbi:MAG: hypothetical protein ND895_27460 [Pyrinomonadaceae bacterium]|nr:hypothetical protein [Pyrinomonadaceae bacterium]
MPRKSDNAEARERLRKYASEIDLPGGRARPRLLSLLFCDFSNRTDDRKINLLGIFDRIYVHPDIMRSPPFVLYGRAAETFEDNLWVRVFDPDNEPQVEMKLDPPPVETLDADRDPDDPKQLQFYLPVQMTFRKEGVYWFDISYRDFSLGGAGLVVRFRRLGADRNATDTFV